MIIYPSLGSSDGLVTKSPTLLDPNVLERRGVTMTTLRVTSRLRLSSFFQSTSSCQFRRVFLSCMIFPLATQLVGCIRIEPAAHFSLLILGCMRNGLLQPAIATGVTANLTTLQDSLSNLERICNTPLPFAYQVHLRMSLWCAEIILTEKHSTKTIFKALSLLPSIPNL